MVTIVADFSKNLNEIKHQEDEVIACLLPDVSFLKPHNTKLYRFQNMFSEQLLNVTNLLFCGKCNASATDK